MKHGFQLCLLFLFLLAWILLLNWINHIPHPNPNHPYSIWIRHNPIRQLFVNSFLPWPFWLVETYTGLWSAFLICNGQLLWIPVHRSNPYNCNTIYQWSISNTYTILIILYSRVLLVYQPCIQQACWTCIYKYPIPSLPRSFLSHQEFWVIEFFSSPWLFLQTQSTLPQIKPIHFDSIHSRMKLISLDILNAQLFTTVSSPFSPLLLQYTIQPNLLDVMEVQLDHIQSYENIPTTPPCHDDDDDDGFIQ